LPFGLPTTFLKARGLFLAGRRPVLLGGFYEPLGLLGVVLPNLISRDQVAHAHELDSRVTLLRACVAEDFKWSRVVAEMAKTHPDAVVRRVLRVVDPWSSSAAKERFVIRALRRPLALTAIERAVLSEIYEDGFTIGEIMCCYRSRTMDWNALRLISNLFFSQIDRRVEISVSRIDRWIDVLSELRIASNQEAFLSWICQHLASAFADEGRDQVLRRANDPEDGARDFVLGEIVVRMSTVTTDDLTKESADRLMTLYLDGDLEPWPSPGNIATERFVAEVVLPLARQRSLSGIRRIGLETILQEAGERHDRRYFVS
jgi:hypothetical protein